MAEQVEEDDLPENQETGDEQETEEDTEETGDEQETEEDTEETGDEQETEDEEGQSSSNRRESRNARQARENRELRERNARLEGELNAAKNMKPVDTADARREREERLKIMSPEERQIFEANEKIQGLQNEGLTTKLLILDMQDKNSFERLCDQNSDAGRVARKHAVEVEKTLAEMRKNNTNAPRKTILAYIIGNQALETTASKQGKKMAQKKKDEANERVKQAKGKPTSARGDAGGGGKGEETAEQMRQRILERERRGDTY